MEHTRRAASAPPAEPASRASGRGLAVYLLLGVVFGIVITKGEVISWFRIQEMFRFQGFHMYGVFLTALPVAIVTVQAFKRSGMMSLAGEKVALPPKAMGRGYRYWIGGSIFGIGWAFTGACPGPLAALVGAGVGVMVVAIASAMVGTWLYGYLRPRLPH